MTKDNKADKKHEDMTSEEKVEYLENKNLYLEADNEYSKTEESTTQEKVSVVCELQLLYPVKILLKIAGLVDG